VFWELIGGAAFAAFISLIVCRVQMAAGPVDLPDAGRKAHRAPTPTSGGIGIAIGYTAALVALTQFGQAVALERQISALVWLASAFAYSFLVIGFADDTRPLGPRSKFLMFTLLSLAGAVTLGVVDVLPLGAGAEWRIGLSLGLFGTALWIFTLVNCVNFMDGANGLAIGSVAIGLFALGAIACDQDLSSAAAMSFCCAGALVGFLVWNFPFGRIFAGDSGALFAGAIAALTSLIVLARSDVSPFVPPILFMPLLADALLTLAWRVRRRRKLLVGHQEHFYQIAIRSGWSHARISALYWGAMLACGLLGFGLSRQGDAAAPWIALATLAGLAIAVSILVRRYARAHGMS
jgi:UDP-N-acetylmuramyl pentapeptide phosphotransferase/UDP-N-acetylglucosamine-1-phosphate transferase